VKKPKILLAVNTKKENYINAVEKCGGIAVAEYCPTFSDEYDGLILCGGNDINPKYYNEPVNGSVDIDDKRDAAEMELFRKFAEAGKPILGICRGCQLINVALGGKLNQNISNAEKHSSFGDFDLVHKVKAEESFLSDIYGNEFFVNSFHHQAVKEPGKGMEIIATADEGETVEALKHRTLPVYAVQWHPERMCFEKAREDTVDGSKIIGFFVKLCTTK